MASTDALPVPRKNVAYRVTFPIYKNDGTLITAATGLDSEVSKDAGTFADCTNEATEIATSSGVYYLDLTATEMNADCVAVIVKTTSTGAAIPSFVLYPQETGDIKVDVTSFGGTAGTFASGRPEVNTTHWIGTAAATPTTAGVPEVDVTFLNGSAANLLNLNASASTIVRGTVDTGAFTPTTTEFEADDVTEATADHFNGRLIIFTSGALINQALRINDYALSGANGHFTVSTATEAPANNDTFVIV